MLYTPAVGDKMGVRGLLSYLKEKGLERYSRRLMVSDTAVFVIDGNSFAHWICNRDRSECPCPAVDMDYLDLRDKVLEFIEEMREAGATCVFLFDSFVESDKLETKILRMRGQVDDLDFLAGSLEQDRSSLYVHSLPLLAVSCIIEVLVKIDTEVAFVQGEADTELVKLALRRNATAIISNDTDMLVYHASSSYTESECRHAPGLIFFNEGFFRDGANEGLYANIVDAQRVADSLTVPHRHLCRVAALCGYDNTDSAVMGEIHAYLASLVKNPEGRRLQKGKGKGKSGAKKCSRRKRKGTRTLTASGDLYSEEPDDMRGEGFAVDGEKSDKASDGGRIGEYVRKANTTRTGGRGAQVRGFSATQALKAAASFVKQHSHIEDGSWLGVTAGDGAPQCIDEEILTCEEHYHLSLQDDGQDTVQPLTAVAAAAAAAAKEVTSVLPLKRLCSSLSSLDSEATPAWEQVWHTGSYLDHPVWRLFSDVESDLRCKHLLQNVRARAYAYLGVSTVMEVTEARGNLTHSLVHAQPPPTTPQPSRPLRSCLLGASTSDDTGKGDEESRDVLNEYASLLLRDLLSEAALFPREPAGDERVVRAFEAMLSSKEVPVDSKAAKTSVTTQNLDCWTLAQVAVLYTNLAAAAVLTPSLKSTMRISTCTLSRECFFLYLFN